MNALGPFTFDEPEDDDLGPWTIGDAAHNDVANIYSDENATVEITREASIATARLFAAAPDLLMQLENVVAAWNRLYAMINPRDSFPSAFVDLAEDTEFRELQSARAAVAKVTGGAP
jgi:hypothetical protein